MLKNISVSFVALLLTVSSACAEDTKPNTNVLQNKPTASAALAVPTVPPKTKHPFHFKKALHHALSPVRFLAGGAGGDGGYYQPVGYYPPYRSFGYNSN